MGRKDDRKHRKQQRRQGERSKKSRHRRYDSSDSRSRSRDRSRRQQRYNQYSDERSQERRVKRQENQLNEPKIQPLDNDKSRQFQAEQQQPRIQKQLPCFEASGILLDFYNSRQGIKLKFTQPQEAAIPVEDWRVYPFKGQETMNPIMLRQSCYLVGKDQRICDILCENTSISRQHAVIQFRQIHKINLDGSYSEFIFPYIMDLDSTNGTLLNDDKIESSRYYQMLDRDILKFGLSQREYVIVKLGQEEQPEQEQA